MSKVPHLQTAEDEARLVATGQARPVAGRNGACATAADGQRPELFLHEADARADCEFAADRAKFMSLRKARSRVPGRVTPFGIGVTYGGVTVGDARPRLERLGSHDHRSRRLRPRSAQALQRPARRLTSGSAIFVASKQTIPLVSDARAGAGPGREVLAGKQARFAARLNQPGAVRGSTARKCLPSSLAAARHDAPGKDRRATAFIDWSGFGRHGNTRRVIRES